MWGNWEHLKKTQKLAEQRTGKYDIKELKKNPLRALLAYFGVTDAKTESLCYGKQHWTYHIL